MSDVNFLDYGSDALRVSNSAFDLSSFLSDNGYLIGFLIGLVIIVGLILFGLFWFWKNLKGLFK